MRWNKGARRGWLLVWTIAVASFTRAVLADESIDITALKDLNVAEIVEQLDSAPCNVWAELGFPKASLDDLLQELIKREGSGVAQTLQVKLRETTEVLELALKQLDAEGLSDIPRQRYGAGSVDSLHHLELLTALRRVQHKSDPLRINVTIPPTITAMTRSLPVLQVELMNRDVLKHSILIRTGEGYRARCLARWRVHVWDQDGKLLPVRKNGVGADRGEAVLDWLKFGESWVGDLTMSDYVDVRTPGEYKVQILYHNQCRISRAEDATALDRLIVFKSDPFLLKVEKGPSITIRLKPESMKQARALIEKLNENHELRIVEGEYTDDFHRFLDPKSVQGELLSMGWQAVPALVDSLPNKTLSFRKRAWLLALLYSISEERDLDPRMVEEILPSCRWQSRFGSGSKGWISFFGIRDRCSVEAQLEFARQWLRFRDDYLVIEPLD